MRRLLPRSAVNADIKHRRDRHAAGRQPAAAGGQARGKWRAGRAQRPALRLSRGYSTTREAISPMAPDSASTASQLTLGFLRGHRAQMAGAGERGEAGMRARRRRRRGACPEAAARPRPPAACQKRRRAARGRVWLAGGGRAGIWSKVAPGSGAAAAGMGDGPKAPEPPVPPPTCARHRVV